MIRWIQKKNRTMTPVHSQSAAVQQRDAGRRAALRTAAAVQIAAQIILWITFGGYDRAVQTVWQAALMLIIPLAALWFLWRSGEGALESKVAVYASLGLLLCLWMDAAFLLYAFSGLMEYYIPEYPYAAGPAAAAAVCWLTVLLSRRNGVAYGTSALKAPLILLFLLSTVLLRSSNRADKLWPLLGRGVVNTALTALGGTGSLWGAALMFVLPGKPRQPTPVRASLRAAIAWAAGSIWALWFAFVRPWAPGDTMDVGERLMGLARHASGVASYSLAGLLWMLLLPAALTGCISAGEVLINRAWPGLARSIAALVVPSAALAAVLIWPSQLPDVLGRVLPWRAVISAAVGLAAAVMARKEAKG